MQVEKAVEERAKDVARWAARKKEDENDDDSLEAVKKPRKVIQRHEEEMPRNIVEAGWSDIYTYIS